MSGNETGERYMFAPDYGNIIRKVGPILRETESSIWFIDDSWGRKKEVRRLKSSGPYFDTWQGAKDFMVGRVKSTLEAYERNVAYTKKHLAEVEAIVQPDPPATPPMQAG